MSQEEADGPSATAFDLLINAIAGSTDYVHPTDLSAAREQPQTSNVDQPLNGTLASASAVQTINKSTRRIRQNGSPTPRQKEISKVLSEQIIHQKGSNNTTATVEIWHPTAGQKSYGKERRRVSPSILAPPPKLCVSGPILSFITSVTLSTTSPSASTSSSQTHLIAPSLPGPLLNLSGTPGVAGIHTEDSTESATKNRSKKTEKSSHQRELIYAARNAGFGATLPRSRSNVEGKDREFLLGDGLNFPGLWIGEEVGKNKEFHLELKVNTGSQFPITHDIQLLEAGIGAEGNQSEEVRQQDLQEQQEQRQQEEEGSGPFPDLHIDHSTSLSEVLDPSSIEVLQPLVEAVQNTNDETDKQTLQEHPPHSQNHISINPPEMETVLEDSNQQTTTGRDPSNEDTRYSIKPVSTPYFTFLSTPLKLVSKPSQKTAKARSMTSCFSINSSFALWTRIHAQTVRTKYMKLECAGSEAEGKLTSKTGKWTPFRFEIIKRALPPAVEKKSKIRNQAQPQPQRQSRTEVEADVSNPNILTYGSTVRLVDLQSGMKSDPVRIVKIESSEHKMTGETDGHPISELQRIGLIRLNTDGSDYLSENGERNYLSAPGARLGGGELIDGRSGRAKPTLNRDKKRPLSMSTSSTHDDSGTIPETLDGIEPQSLPEKEVTEKGEPPKKKKKTKRNALAAAVLAEDEDGGLQTILSWVEASISEIVQQSEERVRVEKVEDWMSWIIGGVACSSQAIYQTDSTSVETLKSIDPLPKTLVSPTFDPQNNTLDLTLSRFHFPSSINPPGAIDEPLEVYLGPIGPLFVTCWRSTSHKNTPTAAIPYSPIEGNLDDEEKVVSSFPADENHVIVRVYLPDIEEIRTVVKDLSAMSKEADGDESSKGQEGIEGTEPTVQDDLTTIEDDQDQIHSQTHVQDERSENKLKDTNIPDTEFLANESKLDPSWFNPEDQSHPPDKLDDLSIATALEMTSTLNDLGPFVSSSTLSDLHQVQGTTDGDGMIIDPSLSEGARGYTHTQSDSHGTLQDPTHRTISDGHHNLGENNTIKLHLSPRSQSDGADIDRSRLKVSLPFVLVRQSDGIGFGIDKSVIIDESSNEFRVI
ncbi:hypothetical protein I204_05172 [Kwoniella mangroviensis CBS 8886]|nr:hypothetical protein I204_05172 [Kwoniella mangroviensis CBS 8886]